MRFLRIKIGIFGVEKLHLHTTVVYIRRPAKLMFGRDYIVALDILYGVSRDISDHMLVGEYIKRLKGLHKVAHSNMSAQQSKVASYYDRKVFDSELEIGQLVYVYQPRMKRRKLAFKIEKRHPVYRVEVGDRKQWVTRDKLKPALVGVRGERPVEQEGKDARNTERNT